MEDSMEGHALQEQLLGLDSEGGLNQSIVLDLDHDPPMTSSQHRPMHSMQPVHETHGDSFQPLVLRNSEINSDKEPTGGGQQSRSRYKYRNDVEEERSFTDDQGDMSSQDNGVQLPFAIIELIAALKDRRNIWKHLLILYTVAFVTFIMAAVAVGRTSGTSSTNQDSTSTQSTAYCQGESDLLWGDQVQSYNGRSYQLVDRRSSSGVTWKDALADAATRCYQGSQGRLATIESAEENNFVHLLLFSAVYTDDENHSLTPDPAWIGGTDLLASPGTFEWILKYSGITSEISSSQFWRDGSTGYAVEGSYTNWKSNEPESSYDDGTDDNVASYCVEMDAESGFWRSDSCLTAKNFFIVEFT